MGKGKKHFKHIICKATLVFLCFGLVMGFIDHVGGVMGLKEVVAAEKEIDDRDIFHYVGHWNSMVKKLKLEKSRKGHFSRCSYKDKNGFSISWQYSPYYRKDVFCAMNIGESDVSIMGIQVGDRRKEIKKKLAAIEEKYNAYGEYNHIDKDKGEGMLCIIVYQEDMGDYCSIKISVEENVVKDWVFVNYIEDEAVMCQLALVKAQEKYGKMPRNSWGMFYFCYISDMYDNYHYSGDDWRYSLFFMNDDQIPELYLKGNYIAQGDKVATIDDNKVNDHYLYWGGGAYARKENFLLESGGHMGVYHDRVLQIDDGKIVEADVGHYREELDESGSVIVDGQGVPILSYEWNGKVVQDNEYADLLAKVINGRKLQEMYLLPDYDYEKIIEIIVKMNISYQDEFYNALKSRNILLSQNIQ